MIPPMSVRQFKQAETSRRSVSFGDINFCRIELSRIVYRGQHYEVRLKYNEPQFRRLVHRSVYNTRDFSSSGSKQILKF